MSSRPAWCARGGGRSPRTPCCDSGRMRHARHPRGRAHDPGVPARCRSPTFRGQGWATFLRNHAKEIRVGDFPPVTALLFRPLSACLVVALAARRVVHVAATRHPTGTRAAQQLREPPLAGSRGTRCATTTARTGPRSRPSPRSAGSRSCARPCAPRANAVCERFRGGVRRECPDHPLALGGRRLARVLREYVAYDNRARPHQGHGRALPEPSADETGSRTGPIRAMSAPGGLHRTYHRADTFSAKTGAGSSAIRTNSHHSWHRPLPPRPHPPGTLVLTGGQPGQDRDRSGLTERGDGNQALGAPGRRETIRRTFGGSASHSEGDG